MKKLIIKTTLLPIIIIGLFWLNNQVSAAPVTVDFETAWGYTVTTNETWTNTDWQRLTTNVYEWTYSLESNAALNDNEDACFEITNNVTWSSENLSFYYRVSSEANYDYLRFSIDWIQQNEWAWTIWWTEATYTLATWNHTLEWCYEKDWSVSNWDDRARVDLVKVSININNISDQVFHYDAFDIDGDWNTDDNPSEWWNVTPWVDSYNSYNATAWTAPTYASESIKTHSWVVFNWSSTLTIWNQSDINTSSFDEKSFAIIFKTWNDINTLQNIYEQWWWTRWYAIQIDWWNLYAWVWNRSERSSWHQYKSLSWTIEANTEYRLIMVQDSTDTLLVDRTFEAILDWTSLWTLTSVDVQRSHWGWIELGRSDWTRRLSTEWSLWAGSNFTWNIWEFFSWNHALWSDEIDAIDDYLYDKWLSQDFPTTPGWVSSWLQIWLKADAWTSTTTNGTSLSSWDDQSDNWFDAWWWTSPTYYNNDTNSLNFNPVVDFNWTSQYLQNLSNWAYTHSYFAVVVPDDQIDGTLTWQVPFWFDCNSGVLNTWTCWLTFAWVVLWAFTIAINDEVITHAIWSSTRWRSAQIWTASYSANKPMLISMNENSSWTWTEISEKWVLINNYTANTYQNLSTADYNIWRSPDSSYPFYYDWKIAEIINYDSRTSQSDKQKIESYLSLKYWMTLNSWTQNYLASDWTTNMWSTTTAWAYTYDIFWIGRDDDSVLWQIKSKSINNDNIITLEAVSEWTNISPSFTDISDLEFLTISNNDWWNTWTETDSPSWYNLLTRKWRVQEIWEVWTVNLDFDVGNTNYDVPATSSWSTYYYVYDSDNDNSLSDETPTAMTNTTWNIWRIAWTDIDHNREFTIATQASSNNIPTDISLSNNILNENISTWSTVWTLSTTDLDSWDSHTYSFVSWTWDDNNSLFSITWSTLSINVSPDYEIKPSFSIRIQTDDWNGWQYQEAFTININNIWETITSLIDFENSIDSYKYSLTSWTWDRNTTNPNEWSYSYESDNGWLHNTQSCFEITHTFSWTWTLEFDYEVSSQNNRDYLRFYIDNNEQDAWSWTVPWTTYTDNSIASWTHTYKWCYIKNGSWSSWTDNAYIDYIEFANWSTDITPPTISSINYASWTLLPWWNHNIIINYSDSESWINTSSDTITLNKWNWSIWWSDISATGFDLWSKTVTATVATYPTNNLVFWKYRYNFSIDDNSLNSSSTWAVFYIDEPEIIISTWALDIWQLEDWITKFSTWINITVETVWAWFDVILNQSWTLLNWAIEIINWNWSEWIWYDQDPYTSTISIINTDEIIATQAWSINTDWNKNTYIYSIKMWALIWEEQAAWNYNSSISFWLDLDY